MKKFVLALMLCGCATATPPCLKTLPPALDKSRLQVVSTQSVGDELMAMLVTTDSFARFSKWVVDTNAWEKQVVNTCSK